MSAPDIETLRQRRNAVVVQLARLVDAVAHDDSHGDTVIDVLRHRLCQVVMNRPSPCVMRHSIRYDAKRLDTVRPDVARQMRIIADAADPDRTNSTCCADHLK